MFPSVVRFCPYSFKVIGILEGYTVLFNGSDKEIIAILP